MNYLFNLNPGSECKYYIPLIILAALLIGGSLAFSFLYKQKKKTDFAFKRLFKKVASRFTLFGVILVVLLAVRYENIPYFSMRVLLFALLLLIAYFIFHYVRIYLTVYPKEKQNVEFRREQSKKTKKTNPYLPNKK